MLSWELHATFAELHPLGSTAPNRVHDPIGNKPQRGYM